MLILVTGGSASGKSEYAEGRAVALNRKDGGNLLYLAAMMPIGEDARMRIERHRKLRSGKGFETIERYRDIAGLCCGGEQMERQFQRMADGATVMLECLSNLTANEMFAESQDGTECRMQTDAADMGKQILKGITALKELTSNLIIVSIDVFGDGRVYDEATENYRYCLGWLNRELASMADEVVEVVYSIPLIHKKTKEGQRCSH